MIYVLWGAITINAIAFFIFLKARNDMVDAKRHYENAKASYERAQEYVEATESLKRSGHDSHDLRSV